jgi:hypothetical protein
MLESPSKWEKIPNKGEKKLHRRVRKRIRGIALNLCRCWKKGCKRCPNKKFVEESLYLTKLIITDYPEDFKSLNITFPEIIEKRTSIYLRKKFFIEYYGHPESVTKTI